VALQTQQYDAAHNLIAGTTVSTADYPVTNLAWTLMETDIVTHANCRGLQLGALVRGLNNIVYVGRMKAYATANVAWII
jgi:hypothetical protein